MDFLLRCSPLLGVPNKNWLNIALAPVLMLLSDACTVYAIPIELLNTNAFARRKATRIDFILVDGDGIPHSRLFWNYVDLGMNNFITVLNEEKPILSIGVFIRETKCRSNDYQFSWELRSANVRKLDVIF